MADHRRQYRRTKSSRRAAVWITAAVIAAAAVTILGIVLLLNADSQQQTQVADLPTLALLPSLTASSAPSDVPSTATLQPVIVVRVITATPLPVSPTATDTSTSTPVPTSTPESATSTPLPSATLEQTHAVPPTLAPADPPTQAFIASPHQTYYVIVGSANLRACARKDCAIVAPLIRNEAVTVSGYTQGDVVSGSNIWFAVQFGGYQGYVHSSLLGVNQIMPTAVPVYVAPPSAYIAPTSAPYVPPSNTSSSSSSNNSGPFTCKDGTISHAAHRQGACSYHGGIAG